MANSFLHSGIGARAVRAGALAITVALGGTLLLDLGAHNGALAQGKKGDAKAAAAPESAWVKLCNQRTVKGKNKDGKEETKTLNECTTLSEHIHPENGMVLVSAMLHQLKIDAEEKQAFEVTVPLGAVLPYGAIVTVLPKDMWEKVQKNQKLDKSDHDKLKNASVKLTYSLCAVTGCTAGVEATAELVNKLKSASGFLVETVHVPMGPIGQRVSLKGFPQALANPPTDTKKFAQAKRELMKGIYERRKQMLAELKKQQEELNKMQPNVRGQAKKK